MLEYKLQFNEEDIINKLRTASEKGGITNLEREALMLPLVRLGGQGPLLVPSKTSKEYLRELGNPVNVLVECSQSFRNLSDIEEPIETLASRYYSSLIVAIDKIKELYKPDVAQSIPERTAQRIKEDRIELIYATNRFFSPKFERESYRLVTEVLVLEYIGILEANNINYMFPGLIELVTTADYIGNVINPLLQNVIDHAFNDNNDTSNRLANPFIRYVEISGEPEKLTAINGPLKSFAGDPMMGPAKNGNYIIKVRDNGFGISKDVTLFEHGSLKKVKGFVEKYRGKIEVETVPGKGTTFTFTVPYSHLDGNFVCVQTPK